MMMYVTSPYDTIAYSVVIQKHPAIGAIEVKDKTRRRCRRWCSRTCIIIAVGVILFLISAAIAGIIAAAIENSMCVCVCVCVVRVCVCCACVCVHALLVSPSSRDVISCQKYFSPLIRIFTSHIPKTNKPTLQLKISITIWGILIFSSVATSGGLKLITIVRVSEMSTDPLQCTTLIM